jgi:hypothetical protein
VTQLLPQAFHGETEQPISSGIGKKNPVKFNAEMKMKAGKHNGASYVDESPHNRLGRNQRTWERRGAIECPEARN